MLRIKQTLKSVGMTQKEFAERLGLSRPTLDLYIEMYENKKELPREKYAIIFDKLFKNEISSPKLFEEKLHQATLLLDRDHKYGTDDLEAEAADYVSLIINNMKKDFNEPGWNKDVYSYINILISNYRTNEIFQQLAEYFIFLNGYRPCDSISEKQISFFSNFYNVFRKLLDKPMEYNSADYEAFLSRCEEIRENKKKITLETKKMLKEKIYDTISELEDKGIDVSEEELIELIKKRL